MIRRSQAQRAAKAEKDFQRVEGGNRLGWGRGSLAGGLDRRVVVVPGVFEAMGEVFDALGPAGTPDEKARGSSA